MLQHINQTAYFGISLEWSKEDKVWIATWVSLKTHGSSKEEALTNLGLVLDHLEPHEINQLTTLSLT